MAHGFPSLPEVCHPAVEGAQKQNDLNLDEAIQVASKTTFQRYFMLFPLWVVVLIIPCYNTVDGTNPVPVDAGHACVTY